MTMAADFAPFQDGHVRLAVLQLLDGSAGYTANNQVLRMGVEAMGLACTGDQLRGHLTWLEEQRLVTTVALGSGVVVATLTERGADVAAGRSVLSGVQRPAPGG